LLLQVDLRERKLAGLKGHHRVAWEEFVLFGLVLPFGGVNAQHNVPNPLLWHAQRGWTLRASEDPLHGWPMDDVLEAGARSGVPPNDLYGSLFFYLSEQLRRFVTKLASTAVSIHVTCSDARELAANLAAAGMAGRLHRVDVSNIVDRNYLGFR
jgi:hypothetical protein